MGRCPGYLNFSLVIFKTEICFPSRPQLLGMTSCIESLCNGFPIVWPLRIQGLKNSNLLLTEREGRTGEY